MNGTTSPMDAQVQASVQRLRERAAGRQPEVAVVLGSGWSAVADDLQNAVDVPYAELPAFPPLAIEGHAGRVRLGHLHTGAHTPPRVVMMLQGRQHTYENGDASAMRGAVLCAAAMGCKAIVITNAAGSANPALMPGDLMVIRDHLNLVQRSPLQGWPGSSRFVDMSCAYDEALLQQALQAAKDAGARTDAGVYAWVMGPQFETPAEIRMLRMLGADAVGMSTVPETIVARMAGLRVLGLSLITNMAAGLSATPLSHAQTLQTAAQHESTARAALQRILLSIVL